MLDKLKQRIQEGLDGKFAGLKNGFKRVNDYIFNVQKSCYTLIGGDSGTFKTTVLDFIVSNAIEDAIAKGIDLTVYYYSFEIDELTKKCNWLSRAVNKKYGVEIPPQKIKGLGYDPSDPDTFDKKLTDDEQQMVDSCVDEVNLMFSKINFIFDPINPTGIRNDVFKHFEKHGTILHESYVNELGQTKQRISGYKPNNPNAHFILCIDHLALMKDEQGFDTKQNIDKMSEYTVQLRNLFGVSSFYLQQFNDSLSSVDRAKFKGVDLSPQKSDFKDSRNPYQDADVVIGLMAPYKLDMPTCLGYDVGRLRRNLIMLKIVKNRLADDNIAFGIYVKPRTGSFIELPKNPQAPEMEQFYKHQI
jgi:replicative DNA helicase